MSTKETIQQAVKDAMRARDQQRLTVLRMLTAAIKQQEIDGQTILDDSQVLNVLDKQAKQRRESIKQYRAGNRQDLADKEAQELVIIQTFLPEPLAENELEQMVVATINKIEAKSIQDMGKVMAALKPQVQGRTDMKTLSANIRSRLA